MRRRRRRATLLLLALTALLGVLVAAGCGGDDDSAEPAPASEPDAAPEPEPATEPEPADPAEPDFDKLQGLVDAQKEIPAFEAPAGEIDVSSLAGKKVFALPILSQLPYTIHIMDGLEEALGAAGVEMSTFENQGDPAQWVQGMNQAIQQQVDVIALIGIDPAFILPQVQEAKDAGIMILAAANFAQGTTRPPEVDEVVDAYTNMPSHDAARRSADWTIIDSQGDAHVLIVTADEVGPSRGIVESIHDEFANECPNCTTTEVNVPLVDWATKGQGEVQSALVANPDINYVYPIYDGMTEFAVPGILGADSDAKVVTVDASQFVLQMLQEGDIVVMDQGYNLVQVGWSNADQIFRMMLGEPVADPQYLVTRIFDDTNIDETGTPPVANEGYGDDYISGFRALWGLE